MRGLVRWMAWSLAGLAILSAIIAGASMAFVQSALRNGALDRPAWTCRRAQDQRLIDRSLTVQIQAWGQGDRTFPSLSWHARGMMALAGLTLTYSPEERRAMALPTLSRTPLCKPLTAG